MSAISQSNLPLVNPRYKPLLNLAIGATGAAVAAALSPWESVKIIGMTVLTGVGYGIANDMVACRDCPEYFTIGHMHGGARVLNTTNPNLNALAWGTIATWHVCAIAGSVFGFMARASIPGLSQKVQATQLAPYMAAGAVTAICISHVKSRLAQKEMEQRPYHKYFAVPLNLQSGWEACNIRNLTGYVSLAIGGVALSVGIVAARAGLFSL
ncbi:MAG: hypothetical protein PVI40_02635 [Chlamydiota bacterium]|jgi:hypothetical protein